MFAALKPRLQDASPDSFYEWANRNDFQLVEVGKVQRSANQLGAQPASSEGFRDLCMDQADAVGVRWYCRKACPSPARSQTGLWPHYV